MRALGEGLEDCGCGCGAGGEGEGVSGVFEGCYCGLEIVSVKVVRNLVRPFCALRRTCLGSSF